jgi:hypothetical protein
MFDESMVLPDQVVQVFEWSQLAALGGWPSAFSSFTALG